MFKHVPFEVTRIITVSLLASKEEEHKKEENGTETCVSAGLSAQHQSWNTRKA